MAFKLGDRVEWSPDGPGTKPQEKGTVKWIGTGSDGSTSDMLGIQFDYPRIFSSRWWTEGGNKDSGAAKGKRLFSSRAHFGGFFVKSTVQIDEDFGESGAKSPKDSAGTLIKNFQVGNRVAWKREYNIRETGTIRWLSILETEESQSSAKKSNKCLCISGSSANSESSEPLRNKIQIAGITFQAPVQISSTYYHHGKTFEIKGPAFGVVVEIGQLERL